MYVKHEIWIILGLSIKKDIIMYTGQDMIFIDCHSTKTKSIAKAYHDYEPWKTIRLTEHWPIHVLELLFLCALAMQSKNCMCMLLDTFYCTGRHHYNIARFSVSLSLSLSHTHTHTHTYTHTNMHAYTLDYTFGWVYISTTMQQTTLSMKIMYNND